MFTLETKSSASFMGNTANQGSALAPLETVFSPDCQNWVSLYPHESANKPPLSRQQELLLGRQATEGRRAQIKLTVNPDLTQEERFILEAEERSGRKAREWLILANTRLVIGVAKRYLGCSVPFSDLVQEGNLGLIRAIDRFDPERGFRLSTYAAWWIRHYISQAIGEETSIRIPRDMKRKRRNAENPNKAGSDNGNVSEKLARKWIINPAMMPVASLERPINGKTFSLSDTLRSPHLLPEDVVIGRELRRLIERCLEELTPKEERVLRLRYGLDGGKSHTFEQIGAKFGLTRARIQQIESEALQKLRHPSRSRRLRDFLE